ncbi:MAG: hypothetical protein WC712_06525 [Candidatus Brocadiia bacterium]
MRATRTPLLILVSVSVLFVGWSHAVHRTITEAAVATQGAGLPEFFAKGAAYAVLASDDPDSFRSYGSKILGSTEEPEHFINMEKLSRSPLPTDRWAFYKMCHDKDLVAEHVGMLPYAVAEWTGRLATAFNNYRYKTDSKELQAKCLVYAGVLAHYAQDLCNPLHTTVFYDGKEEHKGKDLHSRVDWLLIKLQSTRSCVNGLKPYSWNGILMEIATELDKSHGLVETVFALEPEIPANSGVIKSDKVREFAQERIDAAAVFTARLFITAYENSAK